MILISRCPRGGKTTVLFELQKKLRQNGINVISVTFNGVSGFCPLQDETPSESLYRVITNQLDDSIPETARRSCNWRELDEFICSKPFVLLIDEINVLCSEIGSDLAKILKEYFLDKPNRHTVLTSHHPLFHNKEGTEEVIERYASSLEG